MAKTTRASAGRVTHSTKNRTSAKKAITEAATKAAPKSGAERTKQAALARRRTYTPESLAYARHRFEQTDDSVAAIGPDLGISGGAVWHLAKREGWKRYVRPPRGLLPAVKLSMEAEQAQSGIQDEVRGDEQGPLSDTIARLHRLVRDELTELETVRKQPGRRPRGSAAAVRTLSALTETLQKLQRLQPDHANAGSDYDDMPADIDEFRNELARRIEAFVAERTDAGDGRASATSSNAAEV